MSTIRSSMPGCAKKRRRWQGITKCFIASKKLFASWCQRPSKPLRRQRTGGRPSACRKTIKTEVAARIQKELDAGVTRRSMDELDYTTFGELSGIITANWDVFGSLFTSRKAVEKVMASLNSLRGPIAHCSVLAEDEKVRLQLTVRDWFRLME